MCVQKETYQPFGMQLAIQNKSKALEVLLENDAQVDLLFNRNGFSPLMSAKLDTLKLCGGAIKYQLAG